MILQYVEYSARGGTIFRRDSEGCVNHVEECDPGTAMTTWTAADLHFGRG